MRIIGTGATGQAAGVKKKEKGRNADGSFSSILSSSMAGDESSAGAPVESISGINGLLFAQVVEDHSPRQDKIDHGKKLLDILDDLRHDLLMGNVSAETAQKMVDEIKRGRGDFPDPKLNEIIKEIELRAAVELAKLGK